VKKSAFYHTPFAFDVPVRGGGFPSEYRHPMEKTRTVSLPDSEKIFEDMFTRFDVIHERDRRTDKRTDWHSKYRGYASHRAVKIYA